MNHEVVKLLCINDDHIVRVGRVLELVETRIVSRALSRQVCCAKHRAVDLLDGMIWIESFPFCLLHCSEFDNFFENLLADCQRRADYENSFYVPRILDSVSKLFISGSL